MDLWQSGTCCLNRKQAYHDHTLDIVLFAVLPELMSDRDQSRPYKIRHLISAGNFCVSLGLQYVGATYRLIKFMSRADTVRFNVLARRMS